MPRRCSRTTSRRASCWSPTWARVSYLGALRAGGDFDALMGDATSALVRWQLATRPGVLPDYDEALLRRELELFPEWYLGRHLGVALTAAQRAALEGVFRSILERNLAEPRVYVHRDYMPRNLMVSDPNPGVLDFQDAVHGPISYDVASLLRDAFVTWDEERVLDGTIRYWEKARARGPAGARGLRRFLADVEWMGLQRHLKVLGIFARLKHRDGKAGYLEDAPRFEALRAPRRGPLPRARAARPPARRGAGQRARRRATRSDAPRADPRGGTRRAPAAAHRHPAQAAARGGRARAHRVAGAAPGGRGLRGARGEPRAPGVA